MHYCQQCLTTSLRPNASFDDRGICIACLYAKRSRAIYQSNEMRLVELRSWLRQKRQEKGKKRFNKIYDCIVGVSGGKDSTRQAHWVRDRLGMNPLLICGAYPPLQMSEIGGANLSNLLSLGFDLEIHGPAPKTAAKLSLSSFEKFGNVCKASEMALFSIVPRIALEKKIPFIFWGENPALQVGDSATAGISDFDGDNLRNLNTLVAGGNQWLKDDAGNDKAYFYEYPMEDRFLAGRLSIVYLGPAWDDWSMEENATYASLNGLTLRPFDSAITGDLSGASMLDEDFTNINMMLKYFKFGFGRATDYVNELIRSGSMTREEGIEVVKAYDGVCSDSIISAYCHYTSISTDHFWSIANTYVNHEIFKVRPNCRPLPLFEVGKATCD